MDKEGNDPQRREGRLNRRNSTMGIAANMIAIIAAALIGAYATAHSKTVIDVLGGKPAPTVTVTETAGPPAPGPNPTNSGVQSTAVPLPSGQAFTEGAFTISTSGTDLDRNPPEGGNVTTGSVEFTASYPTTLAGYDAQAMVLWTQRGVPTQTQCHDDELSNGVNSLNLDLGGYQQSGQLARFCVLTSEGRDAYVVIPGRTLVSSSPFPAQAFVWPVKIPVN